MSLFFPLNLREEAGFGDSCALHLMNDQIEPLGCLGTS